MVSWLWVVIALIGALVGGAVRGTVDAVPPPPPPPPPLETPVEAFTRGYQDGGGDPAWQGHLVNNVIPCESQWDVDPGGFYHGLAQFDPDTWATAASVTGCWEYTNAHCQGVNVAAWMKAIPGRWGTTAGWPVCWWAGG